MIRLPTLREASKNSCKNCTAEKFYGGKLETPDQSSSRFLSISSATSCQLIASSHARQLAQQNNWRADLNFQLKRQLERSHSKAPSLLPGQPLAPATADKRSRMKRQSPHTAVEAVHLAATAFLIGGNARSCSGALLYDGVTAKQPFGDDHDDIAAMKCLA